MPDVVIFDCNSGNFLTQKTEIKLQYMLIYHAIFNNKTEKSFNLKGCAMNDNFCNMMNHVFQFMANLLITEVKISYSKLGELSVKFHFINLVCNIVGFQPSQTGLNEFYHHLDLLSCITFHIKQVSSFKVYRDILKFF